MSGMAPSRINCFGVMSNEALACGLAGCGVRASWVVLTGTTGKHRVDVNEELSRYG